ncbi:hypothetical protein COCSADRAFT_160446 [Bipolaris sorokiniana ND90Pr]|uniref:Uncharacterized protein n=1 Tax=Cochliobolus sativus (strain ND90Pr / ATCC 201652) TaxID=665912 RepID=M2SPI3_COCSN|nr:uncharacterized protein COCSADRAFT_160446 [Bipolaris sorokiniana ND90Pr]EMD64215.1 hypothetical protein COCSADRAFT_160446 [Bipolaris sorokiniana ND90Pr]
MQDLDYEKLSEAREEPFVDDYQPQNGDSDNEIYSDSEPDASDDFSNIHRAERFLHQGSAFRNLVLGIRLLILPHRLRQIIETTPKNSVALISYNDIGWINNIKSRLETYTGQPSTEVSLLCDKTTKGTPRDVRKHFQTGIGLVRKQQAKKRRIRKLLFKGSYGLHANIQQYIRSLIFQRIV